MVAKVDPEDVATVAFLTDGKVEPSGVAGRDPERRRFALLAPGAVTLLTTGSGVDR